MKYRNLTIKHKMISITVDETTDNRSRKLINILKDSTKKLNFMYSNFLIVNKILMLIFDINLLKNHQKSWGAVTIRAKRLV